MIERTLVLLKPDAVQRCVIGEIISRFEKAGLKIIGMKMNYVSEDQARKHYDEDLEKRRGKEVRDSNIRFITSGPIISICFEGIHAVEIIRKLIGSTEPKSALPGTIRGDYAHMSYSHADKVKKAIPNLIHASDSSESAKKEIKLWFADKELHSYKTVHDLHIL